MFASTLPTSSDWAYSYLVTSVDMNGQESGPSVPVSSSDNLDFIGTTPVYLVTINLDWRFPGAVELANRLQSLRVLWRTAFASGTQYGFVGNA